MYGTRKVMKSMIEDSALILTNAKMVKQSAFLIRNAEILLDRTIAYVHVPLA